MTARFWVLYRDSWVRVAVRPGHTLSFTDGGRTDEGWYQGGAFYEIDGDSLRAEHWDEERDCDGRYSSERHLSCRLDRLDAGGMVDGVPRPDWQVDDMRQRDYSAEAAGY